MSHIIGEEIEEWDVLRLCRLLGVSDIRKLLQVMHKNKINVESLLSYLESVDYKVPSTLERRVEELERKIAEIIPTPVAPAPAPPIAKDEFPDFIKHLYPDYEEHLHSAAMLTVLHEKHKGTTAAIDSYTLAKEMKERFPALFKDKPVGKISFGNIFPGTYLEKRGLIKITTETETGKRMYWVD